MTRYLNPSPLVSADPALDAGIATTKGTRRWSLISFDIDLSTIVLDAAHVEADLAEGFARGPYRSPAPRLSSWIGHGLN
ncbi:MAG: hypothetical protein AAF624_05390 [Bacteroidota bacterium]